MKKQYLEINKISCGYRNGFNLHDVSLSVPQGSFTGIIGQNGSGKSTLFKGITGEISLTKGAITINNTNIAELGLKERARLIAVVPQFMELGPVTVTDYVLMGRIPYLEKFAFSYSADDIKMAARYIRLMNIDHIKDKYITELSGGELQMTAIASALTQQPQLLLLDEPTSHLDITYQTRIMDILHNLNKAEKLTVLMIIHDLNLAGQYCDHIALMNNGKVIRQDSPEEVLTPFNVENAYETKVIIGNHPASGKPVVFPLSQIH